MAALYLERTLELNPEYYTLLSLLADAYLGEGRRREAALAYSRYLAADPQACDRRRSSGGSRRWRRSSSLGPGRGATPAPAP